jgi:GT2 family glycosyltransferase
VQTSLADRSRLSSAIVRSTICASIRCFDRTTRVDGPIPQLYSSANYLIRASVLDRMGYPYLDEAFDYKGGGDTDFFTRARRKGIRFHWAQEALMTETMPERRTEFSWIQARSVRNGMISALIAHKADPSLIGRAKTVVKSLALLGAAPVRGAIDLARTGSPRDRALSRTGRAWASGCRVWPQHRAVQDTGKELSLCLGALRTKVGTGFVSTQCSILL